MIKKIIILSFVLGLGVLPSFAQIGIKGKISKGYFYDTDKSIMTETPLNKTLKTGKYWEKNLFYFNKYRPLFMLSNKELYDLMPKENISVIQRINAPSIYNISLKTASIKTISLGEPVDKKQTSVQDLTLIYEQAKSFETDSDNKIDAAIVLKNSKNPSNYILALDLLNDVTKKEPYNAYAYYIKGEIYSAKKDSENAMKNYVQAFKINPTSKQSCLGIARILETTNKELAKKYYNRAMLLSEK